MTARAKMATARATPRSDTAGLGDGIAQRHLGRELLCGLRARLAAALHRDDNAPDRLRIMGQTAGTIPITEPEPVGIPQRPEEGLDRFASTDGAGSDPELALGLIRFQ